MCATGAADDGVGADVGTLVAVTTGTGGTLVSVGVTGGVGLPTGTVAVGVGIGAVAVGVAGGTVAVGVADGAVAVGVGLGGGLGWHPHVVGVAVGNGGGLVAPAVGTALVGAGLVGAVGLGDDGGGHPQPGWIIRRPVAGRIPAPALAAGPATRAVWDVCASGALRAAPAEVMTSAAPSPAATAVGRIQAARSLRNSGGKVSGFPVSDSRLDAVSRAAR
jgi:hypothetical protein